MEAFAQARARVRSLIEAAQCIADPDHPLGKLARERLPDATGLSPAGVELALRRSLETDTTDDEIEARANAWLMRLWRWTWWRAIMRAPSRPGKRQERGETSGVLLEQIDAQQLEAAARQRSRCIGTLRSHAPALN